MKDEIEILRYTSDKVAKYEATIESYKKKLGNMIIAYIYFLQCMCDKIDSYAI